MRRPLRTTLAVGSAVLTAGAITAAALGFGGSDPSPAGDAAMAPPATEPVTRTDLTQTRQVNGTLGFGRPVAVAARGAGTLTWLPAPGATISRGEPLYKADNDPVVLFYGSMPLYRPLRAADTGEDVREVEVNLEALGYKGFTVDTRFTTSTAAAVTKWQKDNGLPQTGSVDPATVVIATGQVRVASLDAQLGAPAGGPVLSYAATTRVVTVALDVALQNLAFPGVPAQVTLPDRKTVNGVVESVGDVATAGQGNAPATIEVTVTVADQAALGTLVQAPVIVKLTAKTVRGVLTVPVAALVVLPEGGYGVEVVPAGYLAVRVGLFAGGRVEVSGDGLAEGMVVVVPS